MSIPDLLLIASAVVMPVLMLAERIAPARRQPVIRGWPLIGIGFFVAYAVISVLLPLQLPASWFEASLLPGAELGVAGGAVDRFVSRFGSHMSSIAAQVGDLDATLGFLAGQGVRLSSRARAMLQPSAASISRLMPSSSMR